MRGDLKKGEISDWLTCTAADVRCLLTGRTDASLVPYYVARTNICPTVFTKGLIQEVLEFLAIKSQGAFSLVRQC